MVKDVFKQKKACQEISQTNAASADFNVQQKQDENSTLKFF